jgi:hypothetical protein
LTVGARDGLVSFEERCHVDRRPASGAVKKVEAPYFGATTTGERDAAEAAADRLKAKLEEAGRRDPPS